MPVRRDHSSNSSRSSSSSSSRSSRTFSLSSYLERRGVGVGRPGSHMDMAPSAEIIGEVGMRMVWECFLTILRILLTPYDPNHDQSPSLVQFGASSEEELPAGTRIITHPLKVNFRQPGYIGRPSPPPLPQSPPSPQPHYQPHKTEWLCSDSNPHHNLPHTINHTTLR